MGEQKGNMNIVKRWQKEAKFSSSTEGISDSLKQNPIGSNIVRLFSNLEANTKRICLNC